MQFKTKTKIKVLAKSIGLVLLVVGGLAFSFFGFSEPKQEEEHRELGGCDKDTADPPGLVVLYILGCFYVFLALAIICDELFVPSLEVIAEQLEMGPDVAGATLMAAGGSAPELFTSAIGTFQESDVGFGTIVGSAVFNVLFVIAMCVLFSKEVLELTWWPLFRDVIYYALSLAVLSICFTGTSPNEITLLEAIVLFVMYFIYVFIMLKNEKIYSWVINESPLSKYESLKGHDVEEERMTIRRVSTFRAGILQILLSSKDMLDKAGVAIVTKISGNVEETFNKLDKDGNGVLDTSEIAELLRELGLPDSEESVGKVMSEVDTDGDGSVSFEEFTVWYLASEERINAEVREVFEHFDANSNGSIEASELRKVLNGLNHDMEDNDLEEAIQRLDDNHNGEISFQQFFDWYTTTVFYQEDKKKADAAQEAAQGLSLAPPPEEERNFSSMTMYFLSLPLVFCFKMTLPDVHRPGNRKYAVLTFFGSIAWIGFFSFFMVSWAEVIGNTIGIPTVVMGLTFLAAGTSVPDLLSSVIVAKQGEGDMAVSSSIGSNIFDVLVGLPLPWLLYNLVIGKTVKVGAETLGISIVVLLGMLVAVILTIIWSEWKMTKKLGGAMFVLYFVFVAQDLARADWSTC